MAPTSMQTVSLNEREEDIIDRRRDAEGN